MPSDLTSERAWWELRATRTTPPPTAGDFVAWWRRLDSPAILSWDEYGNLWAGSVAINGPVEHDFSAWHHCPPKPTVDQT